MSAGTGRRILIGLAAVVAAALVVLGIWAIVQAIGPTEVEVATDLMDDWTAGWIENDADAVASIFTENAVYVDPVRHLEGRDRIHSFVAGMSPDLTGGGVTGEGTLTADGTMVFPMDFTFDGEAWAGEIEITLEDDLVSRLEWLHWELKE